MVADKGKKQKIAEKGDDENNNNNNSDPIDGELVLSIEKLQEIQDDLEKVIFYFAPFTLFFPFLRIFYGLMIFISVILSSKQGKLEGIKGGSFFLVTFFWDKRLNFY